MPIVQCFAHDVFISYAHIDDEPYGPQKTAWVSAFADDLQKRLSMVAGTRIDVWRDPRLRRNARLWTEIRNRLHNTAILIAVFSPRYVASASCREEWSHFELCSLARGGVLPSVTRAIHVLKLPINRDRVPAMFAGQTGYIFYAIDRERGYASEFDTTSPAYFDAINSLAQDAFEVLEKLRNRAARAAVS